MDAKCPHVDMKTLRIQTKRDQIEGQRLNKIETEPKKVR